MEAVMKIPQPHRMNLDADHLKSLIGGVREVKLNTSSNVRDAVRLIEHQRNEYLNQFEEDNPLMDVEQGDRWFRSSVESALQRVSLFYGDN
jgi:hypothetical protein